MFLKKENQRVIAEGTATWVTDHLSLFSPARARGEAQLLAALKRIGELAMAAEVRERAFPGQGMRWLETAWELFDRGAWLTEWVLRIPVLLILYPPFARCGLRYEGLDELCRSDAWQVQAAAAPGKFQFGLRLALLDCGLPAPGDWKQSFPEEPLAKKPAPASVTAADLYAIAHAVFWITDLGRQKSRLDAESVDYLNSALPAFSRHALSRGNIDLLAEMIITAHCIDLCVPDDDWQALRSAQTHSGLVVCGRTDDPEVWLRGRNEAEIFLQNLHPTLTALMAAHLCAHHD